MTNPTNSDLALWMGWNRGKRTGVWINPDTKFGRMSLPDWRGDKTLWADVLEALPLSWSALFMRNSERSYTCNLIDSANREVDVSGSLCWGDSYRQAFWAAFDAAWPELVKMKEGE